MLTKTYVGYSNDAFLRDILNCLNPANSSSLFPDPSGFDFVKGFAINTRLFVRLTSKTVKGVVRGRGGAGDDVSMIRFEASNSMSGGHAVHLSHFVHRLVCANGMVVPVGGAKGRVFHSGGEVSFHGRLTKLVNEVIGAATKAKAMIEALGATPFAPLPMAAHIDHDLVFQVIPDRNLREEAFNRIAGKTYGNSSRVDREQQKLADAIAEIPYCLGGREALAVFNSRFREGATMFDFVNAFTEYARDLGLRQRQEAEARAGTLAAWIAQNKKKFL